jgi:hypothetical protein
MMKAPGFQDRERERIIGERDRMFRDPGAGLFAGKPRDFVLQEAALNIWEGVREDVIDYFSRNAISWWKGADPTGHLLSSQIACINHLYALRQRQDLADAILQALDAEIIHAEIVDDGFVEFEFIGERQYLQEKSFSGGANCTSVDAFMIGRARNGERRAFLVEWKYTEFYRTEDRYIPERAKVYDHLIAASDSPFNALEPRSLYFEPFYQMMRQTLLGAMIARNKDHGCSSYRNVHVVPKENVEFHGRVTAPDLQGANVSEAWRRVLRDATLYIGTTPADLMGPLEGQKDTKALTGYLRRRYWSGS